MVGKKIPNKRQEEPDVEIELSVSYENDRAQKLDHFKDNRRVSQFWRDLSALGFVNPSRHNCHWAPPDKMRGIWKTTKDNILYKHTKKNAFNIRSRENAFTNDILKERSITNCSFTERDLKNGAPEALRLGWPQFGPSAGDSYKRPRSPSLSGEPPFPPRRKYIALEEDATSKGVWTTSVKREKREHFDPSGRGPTTDYRKETFGTAAPGLPTLNHIAPKYQNFSRTHSSPQLHGNSADRYSMGRSGSQEQFHSSSGNMSLRTSQSPTASADLPRSKDASVLTRELFDIRRQLSACNAREAALIRELRAQGVSESELLSRRDRDLNSLQYRLEATELELRREVNLREQAQRMLSEVEQECRSPFIVPELLHAFIKLSELTTGAS